MATNRGAYDPRQFLHYPDKDPFSDVAQKRLDELIKDFLNTGIAFANGAGVQSNNAEDLRGRADLSNGDFDDGTHEEYRAFDDAMVNVSGNEEDEDFESEFSKVDKGKGRDEREGPGLKGLWNSTPRFSPDASPPGPSVDDATSLLSDNGSQGLEENNGGPNDRSGYFEEVYENEELDEGPVGDEEEDDPDNAEFVPGHSSSPSSEQEIIYIGDSDEEGEPQEAMSDIEADAFEDKREWMRGAVQYNDNENGANWGSGSDFGEEKERLELVGAWNYSLQGQDMDDNAQEPEWHQTQGKESDDDEGGYEKDDGGPEEDGRDDDSDRRPYIDQPRRFFASTSLVDPWTVFSDTSTKIGLPVLAPAAWEEQHLQGHNDDQIEKNMDDTEEIQIVSLESVQDDVHPEGVDDTEAHGLGPHPELQSADHMEDLISSYTPGNADLTGMPYLQPISERDAVASEGIPHDLDPAGLSSGGSGEAIDIPHIDLTMEVAFPQDLEHTAHTFSSSQTSPELQLEVGVNVPKSLDDSHIVSTASNGVDHQAHESTSADRQPTPSIHVQDPPGKSTIDEVASESSVDHSAVTLPQPSTSQRNESNSDRPDITPDPLEWTHASEERHSPFPPILLDETAPAEPTPLHDPATPPAGNFAPHPLESSTHSSSFAEEESIDESPSKPVLLHPAVFDDRELMHAPTHTEGRCQSPLSGFPTGCAGSDIVIHDKVDDATSDKVIVTTVVSEHEEDPHNIQGAPKTLETQEVGDPHPEDVIFEYVVCEPMSEASAIRTETTLLPITIEDSAQRYNSEDGLLLKSAPAISVGSDTPPLSPTATVTNSSSAPDPSIATSDLSTVNQAPVSVVTSAGSPPPIHVPRLSTTHADVRQPLTHVGYGSDDEQNSGDGMTILPDPRLPPEPTHLGIPVGVVGRSLAVDKEERAESMKVEPPRSESEGSSQIGEGRNKHSEGVPPAQAVEEVLQNFQDNVIEHTKEQFAADEGASARPVDQMVTEVNIQKKVEEEHVEDASDELVYPDSISDHVSKEDGEERVSQPPTDFHNNSATEGYNMSQSLPSSPEASELPLGNLWNLATAVISDTEVSPKPPPKDATDHVAKSHMGLNVETESFLQRENGVEAEQYIDSLSAEALRVSNAVNNVATPSISSERESTSLAESESKSRESTKSNARTKAVHRRAVSPPPVPQSIIYVHPRRSTTSLKRSRPFETLNEPSKHPRLARSPTTIKSSSVTGDTTSTSGTFDDKSDVSSVTSSSSAVSRLLVQRGNSSLPSLSRSSSMKSQPSPTAADQSFTMPPPIRRYVPHNHNHAPTAAPSRRTSVERATQMHLKPSVSPSPTPQPPQPSSTHQTRASCTDHKISLPGPDGLLYFLVPRCSLLDPEVEKDASIVDCGVATRDEVERAIGDLEAIYLDSTTLGVIRQLAGIQLMREGQVGYLPQPGDSFRHRVRHGRPQIHHTSPAQDLSHKVDLNTQPRVGPSRMASLGLEAVLSPVSNSGSYFSDIVKDGREFLNKGPKVSQADDEAYEATSEDDDDANYLEGESVIPPSSSLKSVRSPKATGSRRRKLRPEDAAYKPEIEATGSSSDNGNIGGKKRVKRSSRRKTGEGTTQGDGKSRNMETPSPKKRKRKYTEKQDSLDGPLDGTYDTPRKKARRKKVDERHTEDNVTTAI